MMKKQAKDRVQLPMIFVGIGFCAFSVLFASLVIWQPHAEKNELARWNTVPCRIEKSNVEQKGIDKFDFMATYSYDVGGKQYKSSVIGYSKAKTYNFDSVRHRLPLLEKYAPGTEHECRVKPDDPRKAVMTVQADGRKDFMSSVMFAMLGFFMVVGIGLISQAFPAVRRRMSDSVKSFALCIFLMLFGVPFSILGIGSVVSGYRHWTASKEYLPTQAKVLYSGISSHSGSKGGTTYAPVVGYEYYVNGKKYENDRFRYLKGYTSNYKLHRSEADRYHKGDEITIWRSPDDPQESVIDQKAVSWPMMAGMALFGIVGLGIILGSIGYCVRACRKIVRGKSTVTFFNEPLRRSRADVIFLGCFALGWNVFSWSAAAAVTGGFDVSQIKTGGGLFVLIFPLVGLGLLSGFISKLVSNIRGPHFKVAISCDSWRPGAYVSVNYEQIGDGDVEAFKVNLEQTLKCDQFSNTRTSHRQPAPSRKRQVYESGSILKTGNFSFTIPDFFTMEDATSWSLVLSFRTASRTKELKDVFNIPC